MRPDAKTWLPWSLVLILVGVQGWTSWTTRRAAPVPVGSSKTPDPASNRPDPWIHIGGGSVLVDLPKDRLQLVHESSILVSDEKRCLLRSSSVLIEVDGDGKILRQGSANIAVTQLADCAHLIKTYGPACPDPRLPGCGPVNGQRPQ